MIEAAAERGVGIDTAFNYLGFGSHRRLASILGGSIQQVAISTKVGLFPGAVSGSSEHSLAPARLRSALRRAVDELGVRPMVMFLHSPERSLADSSVGAARAADNPAGSSAGYKAANGPPDVAADISALAAACAVLAEATSTGWCRQWGIACWNPYPLLATVAAGYDGPHPDVLMTRAGLTLDGSQVTAIDELAARLGVSETARWGMSPFSGHADHPVWTTTRFDTLLRSGQRYSAQQAVVRLAFDLPPCVKVAVGTDNPAHLREIIDAAGLAHDRQALTRYRDLIGASTPIHGPGQTAGSHP